MKTGIVLALFAFVFSLASFTANSQKTPFVVVVNAGHGGKDPGAKANNAVEKTINLKVAKKLAALNSKEVKIILVRDKDAFMSLSDRIAFINRQHADMLLSLHCGISEDSTKNGMKLLTAYNGAELVMTQHFVTSLATAYVFQRLGTTLVTRTANKPKTISSDFKILSATDKPTLAVRLDLGFLSNKLDAKRLTDANYQKAVARVIYMSLVDVSKKEGDH